MSISICAVGVTPRVVRAASLTTCASATATRSPIDRVSTAELIEQHEIRDQARDALCIAVDRRQELLRGLGVDRAAEQGLRVARDRGHRRAQLVRCVRQELAAHGLERAHPRDVVEHQDDRRPRRGCCAPRAGARSRARCVRRARAPRRRARRPVARCDQRGERRRQRAGRRAASRLRSRARSAPARSTTTTPSTRLANTTCSKSRSCLSSPMCVLTSPAITIIARASTPISPPAAVADAGGGDVVFALREPFRGRGHRLDRPRDRAHEDPGQQQRSRETRTPNAEQQPVAHARARLDDIAERNREPDHPVEIRRHRDQVLAVARPA